MKIALIEPVADNVLTNVYDRPMVAYVPRQALSQNRPQLLSVLGAGLNYIELIADALCDIAFAVVVAQLIIEVRYRACEAQQLIAVKLIKLELLPVLYRNYAGGIADTLYRLGQSYIFKELVYRLNIALYKLFKAIVTVL